MDKNIIRKARTRKNPYTLILRKSLQDPGLSLKAKGLLAYVLSLPDDWKLHVRELVKHFKDGKFAVRGAFTELKNAGYIKGHQLRDDNGAFSGYEFLVFEDPGEYEETSIEPADDFYHQAYEQQMKKDLESKGLKWTNPKVH